MSRADQAAARAGSAQARVEAAEAALRYAQATLENTYIRAPFTGTVLRKEAEVGEVVAPSVGGGLTRGAVVTMADLTTLEVEVDVNEAYIARVHHGQPARITLDAYPDTSFRGDGAAGGAHRRPAAGHGAGQGEHHRPRPADPARDGRAGGLPRSDSGRTAAAPAAAAPARFRLPAAAVRESGGRSVVWLVRDGRLQAREVEAGPVSAGFREVSRAWRAASGW